MKRPVLVWRCWVYIPHREKFYKDFTDQPTANRYAKDMVETGPAGMVIGPEPIDNYLDLREPYNVRPAKIARIR